MRRWIAAHSVLILSAAIIIGAAAYSLFVPPFLSSVLVAAEGTRIRIEGVVVRPPDVRERMVQITVQTPQGLILVRADRFITYQYGDRVRVEGVLERPESFVTDSERVFNYPMYLYVHGITHVISFAEVEVLASGEGNPFLAGLVSVKDWMADAIAVAVPEPESALLAGLLLGEKRGLGDKLTELFRRAGLVHIIVLSGYNIALIINTVRMLASMLLPRIGALFVSAIAALVFMLMTGASETAIRATFMALVVLMAQALHRPADGLRILGIVAATMAVWNPYLVLYDLSYQLSVTATFGLIVFSKKIQHYFAFLRSKPLSEIVATTLATQIAVLPLLIFSIGQVSIISLISNILILPVVPYAMLAGFVSALVASVSATLAFPFSAVAYALLHYIILLAEFLGSMPYAAVTV